MGDGWRPVFCRWADRWVAIERDDLGAARPWRTSSVPRPEPSRPTPTCHWPRDSLSLPRSAYPKTLRVSMLFSTADLV
jgi:hypothetical protein